MFLPRSKLQPKSSGSGVSKPLNLFIICVWYYFFVNYFKIRLKGNFYGQ